MRKDIQVCISSEKHKIVHEGKTSYVSMQYILSLLIGYRLVYNWTLFVQLI